MVDASGNARIIDFGLASIVWGPSSMASVTNGYGHTPRWTVPEILGDGTPASKKSGVFLFSLVIIEAGGRLAFRIPTTLESLGWVRFSLEQFRSMPQRRRFLTKRCWTPATVLSFTGSTQPVPTPSVDDVPSVQSASPLVAFCVTLFLHRVS